MFDLKQWYKSATSAAFLSEELERKSEEAPEVAGKSLTSEAWRRLKKNRMALAAMIYLAAIVILCFTAQWIIPFSWDEVNFVTEAEAPSNIHWFGTDELGRDLLARVLYGGRVSLSVGFVTALISMVIGVSYGAIAGYVGGARDRWMMRVVDVLYALPSYFILLLVMVFFSINSIYLLFLFLAAFQWLGMARIVRGQILSLKERDFVTALRSCGASPARIVFLHLIPNCLGVICVYATLTVPGIILQEAFLSFIGISFEVRGSDGVMKPIASWGTLISEGAKVVDTAPWLLLYPALFFSLTLLAINFLGDGLRDAFDPNMKV
jgi:oligopeptide transport system permease protein